MHQGCDSFQRGGDNMNQIEPICTNPWDSIRITCRTKVFTKVLSSLVRTLRHPSSKVTTPVTLPARVQLWITTRLAMFDPLIFALRLCRFIYYGNEKNKEKSSGNGWKKKQTNGDKTSDLHETKFWNKVRDDRVDGGESVLKRPADRFFRVESVQRFFSGWTIPTSNSWNSSAHLIYWYHFTYIYILYPLLLMNQSSTSLSHFFGGGKFLPDLFKPPPGSVSGPVETPAATSASVIPTWSPGVENKSLTWKKAIWW